MAGFLHKDHVVAGPGFSRWWNIPAVLCINRPLRASTRSTGLREEPAHRDGVGELAPGKASFVK
jgi:hypothetical protein